jgi:dihydroorotate dehydrogenase (fumarate)
MVLFNRFYQPDIDLENLTVRPSVLLSTAEASRLPLTWIGILYGRVNASLAATSGIHAPEDVVKMLMVGARVTMLCSVLLRKGIGHLSTIECGLAEWMKKHGCDSVGQMQGKLGQGGTFARHRSSRDQPGIEKQLHCQLLQ